MILAKDAVAGKQYRSKKGRIIELKPLCDKRDIPMGDGILYRYIGNTERVFFGKIPGDYELEEIAPEEQIQIPVTYKEPKAKASSAKYFNIKKYIRGNKNKSLEEMLAELSALQGKGITFKCKRPLNEVLKIMKRDVEKEGN